MVSPHSVKKSTTREKTKITEVPSKGKKDSYSRVLRREKNPITKGTLEMGMKEREKARSGRRLKEYEGKGPRERDYINRQRWKVKTKKGNI